MNRLIFLGASLLGASAVIWMASTFIGKNSLALGVTLVIAAVYAIGILELLQFRRATTTLSSALASAGEVMEEGAQQLDRWVASLHPSLQNAVRLRIEGDRVGLPAPIVTPYLVGLLVMLGLLGTFIGMVDTLSGAVIALEGTTELQAIRAGLAAPINGLSVAFGTSVAGVAASAMLGLVSTLSRRDRMLATRVLDTKISGVFRPFTLAYSRQETYQALQLQAQALPDVAEKLNVMALQLSQSEERLSDKLLSNQQQFHQTSQTIYQNLAASVEASLKASLADSGRMAGESIAPVVAQAMAEITQDTRAGYRELTEASQQQSEAMVASFGSTTEAVTEAWNSGLSAQEAGQEKLFAAIGTSLDGINGKFEATANSLLESLGESSSAALAGISSRLSDEFQKHLEVQQASLEAAIQQFTTMSGAVTTQWSQAGEQIVEINSTLESGLSTLRREEEERSLATIEQMAALESTVATHLASLGKEMEAPMARLIETASETPRAAAEVIGKLREEVSNNIERDNQLLEERQRTLEQLNTLSATLSQSSAGQREALESLVSSSAQLLDRVGERFDEQVGKQLGEMSGVAEHFSGSASEMASMGEAFAAAVSLFNESNGKLMDAMVRIEQSMDNANARSDEQMNYYVAQARQIIDQSMRSQREIFEELRLLGSTNVAEAS